MATQLKVHSTNTPEASTVQTPHNGMGRRDFLRLGLAGISAVALDALTPAWLRSADAAAAGPTLIRLSMVECLVEMVDEIRVYTWAFADATGPKFPGPVITAIEGSRLDISITNKLHEDHAFTIPGVANSGVIRKGQTRLVKLTVPKAGTYIYLDDLNAPLNRVMGLHGVLVSLPQSGNTPYSQPTSQVQQLFDDLGTHPVFPGEPWKTPNTVIWVFSQVDPDMNDRVFNGEVSKGAVFARQFQPRYFTINGRSGYFSAHAHDTHLHSSVGRPHLIRNVNVGLWGHSPHTHCNHSYVLAVNGQVQDNVILLDTWTMRPMDRKDVLFPFIKPPDIPDEVWEKCVAGTQEEPFPMHYPMHCHQEVSNTAAGGNYPQGNVTHIDLLGPLGQIGTPGDPPDGLPGDSSDEPDGGDPTGTDTTDTSTTDPTGTTDPTDNAGDETHVH